MKNLKSFIDGLISLPAFLMLAVPFAYHLYRHYKIDCNNNGQPIISFSAFMIKFSEELYGALMHIWGRGAWLITEYSIAILFYGIIIKTIFL